LSGSSQVTKGRKVTVEGKEISKSEGLNQKRGMRKAFFLNDFMTDHDSNDGQVDELAGGKISRNDDFFFLLRSRPFLYFLTQEMLSRKVYKEKVG